jgi:small subunit ribosomal protein S16
MPLEGYFFRQMLTIRLQRVGRKNDPSFRVILVEKKRAAKTGNVAEILGNYNARTGATVLSGERIKDLMKNGVTISDNLHNLLINNKIIDGKKKDVNPKKSVEKVEAKEEVAAPAAAPETKEEGTVDASPAAEVKEETPEAEKVDNEAAA